MERCKLEQSITKKLKNNVAEMKNTFDGLTSKLDTVRERNSELEVGLIQTAQPEQGNNR